MRTMYPKFFERIIIKQYKEFIFSVCDRITRKKKTRIIQKSIKDTLYHLRIIFTNTNWIYCTTYFFLSVFPQIKRQTKYCFNEKNYENSLDRNGMLSKNDSSDCFCSFEIHTKKRTYHKNINYILMQNKQHHNLPEIDDFHLLSFVKFHFHVP